MLDISKVEGMLPATKWHPSPNQRSIPGYVYVKIDGKWGLYFTPHNPMSSGINGIFLIEPSFERISHDNGNRFVGVNGDVNTTIDISKKVRPLIEKSKKQRAA